VVADVLSDDAARIGGFGAQSVLDLPFSVAVKTGTSSDYRNSWCIGFGRDRVVGVWAGNFDATPIRGLVGATGAGPVFRAVMLQLAGRGSGPWTASPPPGWRRERVCGLSGGVPGEACAATQLEWFPKSAYARRARCAFHVFSNGVPSVAWPAEYREWARDNEIAAAPRAPASAPAPRILSPIDGSVYFRDPRLESSAIRFVAESPHPDDAWFLDGQALRDQSSRGPLWFPRPGTHRLRLARGGAAAEIRFSVR
jgi:penicillin-binding protein 1C